jgi:hypothetical protein
MYVHMNLYKRVHALKITGEGSNVRTFPMWQRPSDFHEGGKFHDMLNKYKLLKIGVILKKTRRK